MKVLTIRTHYEANKNELGLEETINNIGYENVLEIMPAYYGQGEVGYTIVYRTKEEWE